jgi:hypothetical protein
MLDYDAIVDINSNIAYPVYLKIKNNQKYKTSTRIKASGKD